jgi:IPT/TIG domain
MKFNNSSLLRFALGVGVLATALVTACVKQDETSGIEALGAPGIERFRIVAKDSAITGGGPGLLVAIIGNNLQGTDQLFVNGTATYFNPALGSNTSLLFRIAEGTPWKGGDNKIKVVNKWGSAEKEFKISQPAPKITSFDPLSGGAGDVVTIKGEVFDNLKEVRFGTTVAEIVSKSDTEIKVKVPAGVNSAYIFVTTEGGAVRSEKTWGIAFILYQDGFDTGKYWLAGWGNKQEADSKEVFRGTQAIKQTYNPGWNGFIFGSNPPGVIDLKANKLSAFKISIYGGEGSEGVNMVVWFNDNDKIQVPIPALKEKQWNDFTIPLDAKFGSPTEFKSFYLMSPGTTKDLVIYIDDIGLI